MLPFACGSFGSFTTVTCNSLLAFAESKVGLTTCPVRRATQTRRGEGRNASTIDVAKAVAEYAD